MHDTRKEKQTCQQGQYYRNINEEDSFSTAIIREEKLWPSFPKTCSFKTISATLDYFSIIVIIEFAMFLV